MVKIGRLGQPAEAQLPAHPGGADDADQLAENQSGNHSEGNRVQHRRTTGKAVDRNAGVGQCKNRYHQESHRCMQARFHALQRRLRHVDTVVQRHHPRAQRIVGDDLVSGTETAVEAANDVFHEGTERNRIVLGPRRHRHGGDDTRQGCMHTAQVKFVPQQQADKDVGRCTAHPGELEQPQDHHQQSGPHQRDGIDALGIPDGNHQNRTQIVDNRQRHEEGHHGAGHAIAEQGDTAHREGDICRHRDTPAARLDTVTVEAGINQRRYHHAADGRHHRQHCLFQVRQLTDEELPFQFEPHQEKEHGHQAIVDPVVQAQGERPVAYTQADRQVQQVLVSFL